ncbi:hypothetical protein BC937DRAFT_89035 [Endogone sp. FLAS-F59071]|nr:hypothetical protein BC937DRAFT_89035 [Endogone sp. FLAS-F59071]|eukprot:RUS18208.1 hypothetical protein BC937DRAFT_89035 [Endogone sp. FLAS-F59071]
MEDASVDEQLDYIILLRDPIVRSFMEADPQSDDRIKQTRWRIHDVWKNYISEAWVFFDEKTYVYNWSKEDQEKFDEDYGTESDTIKPTDAVRAALFVFFIANKEAVFKAKPTVPTARIEAEGEGNDTSVGLFDLEDEFEKAEEEAVKRANEPQKLKIEQGVDNPHWSIHQYFIAEQETVDSLVTINDALEEELQAWFDKHLEEGIITNIPYEDIQDKDVANVLGRGDTASVYRATWNKTEIALKQFFERRLFLREIRAVYEIGSHRNIIVVYGKFFNRRIRNRYRAGEPRKFR